MIRATMELPSGFSQMPKTSHTWLPTLSPFQNWTQTRLIVLFRANTTNLYCKIKGIAVSNSSFGLAPAPKISTPPLSLSALKCGSLSKDHRFERKSASTSRCSTLSLTNFSDCSADIPTLREACRVPCANTAASSTSTTSRKERNEPLSSRSTS